MNQRFLVYFSLFRYAKIGYFQYSEHNNWTKIIEFNFKSTKYFFQPASIKHKSVTLPVELAENQV